MTAVRLEENRRLFQTIPGGLELLKFFHENVSFGDAEIVSFELHRRGTSILKLHWWWLDRNSVSGAATPSDSLVTFLLRDISDLELSGFSHQNVIGGLYFSLRPKDPERSSSYDFCATELDYHLTLEPCYGLDGFIRCGRISVSVAPGKPADDYSKGQTLAKDMS